MASRNVDDPKRFLDPRTIARITAIAAIVAAIVLTVAALLWLDHRPRTARLTTSQTKARRPCGRVADRHSQPRADKTLHAPVDVRV